MINTSFSSSIPLLLTLFFLSLVLTPITYADEYRYKYEYEEPSYIGYPVDNSNIPYDGIESPSEKEEHSILHKILMWLPNRIMDVIDIFRFDVGVGPSFGGVVRVTKYGQLAFRGAAPVSVRVGNFGRRPPVMLETSNEIAFGPSFVESRDRDVCIGEIGVGADLFVAGAYGGVCVDQIADLIAGIFFIDLSGDDW